MENKYKVVHDLQKVKLILGNGFDLQCHLKTSYSDYFLFDSSKNDALKNWVEIFESKAEDYLSFQISNHKSAWKELKGFDYFNIWDILFYLVSFENKDICKWNWCDIESTIANCLSNCDVELTTIASCLSNHHNQKATFNFELIFKILSKKIQLYNIKDKRILILTGFIYKKNNEECFSNRRDYYDFLLSQLKLFEINFGKYIYNQHCDDSNKSFDVIVLNNQFKKEAKKTIENLCTLGNITSVDTFNYDTPECGEIEALVHHINGNINSPIFGIDSDIFDADDPRYIFSKTSRRIDLEMNRETIESILEYENIIIFGCSLNKADYNYFFSIFDELRITDPTTTSKIVFAYSIYDKEKKENIHRNINQSVTKLFQEYSKYKGNNIHFTRLLELLMIQQKIVFFEIPFEENIESYYFNKNRMQYI